MLSNTNKIRHAQNVAQGIDRLTVAEGVWKKAVTPIMRVGSTRTADGAAFLLSDKRYVAKLMFYSTTRDMDNIYNEYYIGEELGDAGVGPKVYALLHVDFKPSRLPTNLLRNSKPGRSGYFIIMENIAYGATRLETLSEYVRRTKVYPLKQIEKLYNKMYEDGVIHGDLHAGNILIKSVKGSPARAYIIDFGRSKLVENINTFFKGLEPAKGYPGYYYNANGNIVGSNKEILNRNYKILTGKSPRVAKNKRIVSPVESAPRNLFKTPLKLSKSFFRSTTGC